MSYRPEEYEYFTLNGKLYRITRGNRLRVLKDIIKGKLNLANDSQGEARSKLVSPRGYRANYTRETVENWDNLTPEKAQTLLTYDLDSVVIKE